MDENEKEKERDKGEAERIFGTNVVTDCRCLCTNTHDGRVTCAVHEN